MNARFASFALASLLALPACKSAVDGNTPPEEVHTTPCEVRVRGANADGVSALLLRTGHVVASGNGSPLSVRPSQASMDLSNTQQAWLVGTVDVPDDVRHVDFELRFDDYGGYEFAGGSGSVDARRAPIRWTAPVEWLKKDGHAVVEVDVKRSVIRAVRPDEFKLVPAVSIHY